MVILISGALLFISEAVRSFHSGPFRIKIVLLVAAVLFHYTISRRLVNQEEDQLSPALRQFAGVFAIALWMSIGFAGRAIGFF
jgi:uncharacterized membrane protein